jgi:hypothetical protein
MRSPGLSSRRRCPWFFLLALLLLLASCSMGEQIRPDFLNTPTPLPPPTPVGDTLELFVASYQTALRIGESVPGTRLTFVNKIGDTYTVLIDGQSAEKRAGDSFDWDGVIVPGVVANFRLNLLPNAEVDLLRANGTVRLTVFSPQPAPGAKPIGNDVITLGDIRVDALVPRGRALPGTPLVYEQDEPGAVIFSGTENYARYRFGDSLTWRGLLLNNVYIDYSLKVDGIETHGVRVNGTAEMTLDPTPNQ